MATQLELAQRPFIELQIEALVEENSVKPKRVNKFISELESRLISLDETDYEDLLNTTFRLPLLGRPNSINDDYPRHFKFKTPSKIDIIGGFKTATAIKKTNHVDLAICMPIECLEKKDIKNQRYHHKRALYLAQLGHILKRLIAHDLIERCEFRYHQGDFLKPVLIITPKVSQLKANTTFQLFVYPPDGVLKATMLHPAHGNVAPKWFLKDYPLDEASSEELKEFSEGDSDVLATPFYNSSILFDIEMVSNSEILFEQIGNQKSLTEALMLSKIWLHQRELHGHFSFIISMFIAYLQTQQVIHQNMSSYQIFKTVIKSIATSDWINAGISYFDDTKEKHIPAFESTFPVVFLSPSGRLNLCYNITADLYNRLKHEAEISHSLLVANSPDTFELLFLKKLDFMNKFDVIIHIPKCTKKLPMNLDNLKKLLDHGVFAPRVYSESILRLVKEGLRDRVALIQQSSKHLLLDKKWNLRGIPYDPSNEDSPFTIGLLLAEAEKSLRIIDVGPGAQTPEAEKFRHFWGPKSHLRLQNGVISETVVWHVDSFSQRRSIIKYIITHALRHARINDVVVHHTLLERFIALKNVHFQWRDDNASKKQLNSNPEIGQKRKLYELGTPIGVGEDVFQKVLQAYNNLGKVVRSIEDLKYPITAIQPVSAHLRGSAVFPPLPVGLQTRNKSLKRRKGVSLFPTDFNDAGKILHIEPVDILLTLESSAKWPSELEALEAAQLQYLIQLGESLKEKEYSVKFSANYLDVLQGQFVFRLRVKCAKYVALQRKRLEWEIVPGVHASLDQLYREKPAFGLTCRLVKRWLACHLMTDHVSEIAIELMVAHLFVHPQPYTEPSSSACGFRRFLMLIAQHDWKQCPLVINFDNQLKLDEVNRLKDSMLKERSKFPPIVIYTPYDKETSPWTRPNPIMPILDLLCRICNKGFQFLNKEILSNLDVAEKCNALFRPNFKTFDLIIKLHPQIVQNFFMSIDTPKSFQLSGKESTEQNASAFKVMPIIGLNVVEQYVKILRSNYDNVALFFYDKYGQRVIGVVLKPESEKILGGDLGKFMGSMKKLGSKLVDSISITKSIVKGDST